MTEEEKLVDDWIDAREFRIAAERHMEDAIRDFERKYAYMKEKAAAIDAFRKSQ